MYRYVCEFVSVCVRALCVCVCEYPCLFLEMKLFELTLSSARAERHEEKE